jgi:signal transduction histidine kinase/ActR/RegA family two-component response regulator
MIKYEWMEALILIGEESNSRKVIDFVEKEELPLLVVDSQDKNLLLTLAKVDVLKDLLWENLPCGLILADKDRNIIYINNFAKIVFPEADKIDSILLLTPEEREDMDSTFEKSNIWRKKAILKKHNREYHLVYSLLQLKEEEKILGFMCIVEDISSLEEAYKAKELNFLSLTHEFKTPLACIKGASELLLKGNSFKNQEIKLLQIIYSNSERLHKLITSLLQFARVKYKGLELSRQLHDFSSILNNVLKDMNILFKQWNIEVEVEIPPPIPFIYVDATYIEEVINNLLLNSIEALKMQDEPRYIKIEANKKEEYLEVTVDDNGIGVPEGKEESIFADFVKIPETKRGAGLGLSIARAIIREHGGELYLDHKKGRGARFKFTLPLEVKLEKPYPKGEIEVIEAPVGEKRQLLRSILIIDEDKDFLEVQKRNLISYGYSVTTAEGVKGLEYAENLYDLILLEVHMQTIDGYSLLRKLREKPALKRIPIIIVSTKEARIAYQEEDLKSLGVISYLEKPISQEGLIAALDKANQYLLFLRAKEKILLILDYLSLPIKNWIKEIGYHAVWIPSLELFPSITPLFPFTLCIIEWEAVSNLPKREEYLDILKNIPKLIISSSQKAFPYINQVFPKKTKKLSFPMKKERFFTELNYFLETQATAERLEEFFKTFS